MPIRSVVVDGRGSENTGAKRENMTTKETEPRESYINERMCHGRDGDERVNLAQEKSGLKKT